MADEERPTNKEKWIKALEKAGFSHRNGERIICYNCNLRPRSGGGLNNPAKLHVELSQNCAYVKENDLVAKCLNEQIGSDEAYTRNVGCNHAGTGDQLFTDIPGNNVQRIEHLPNPCLLDRDQNARLKEMQRKTTCMTCSEECPSYVFIPCGHVFCSECARGQSRCIKCSLVIARKDRFYWA